MPCGSFIHTFCSKLGRVHKRILIPSLRHNPRQNLKNCFGSTQGHAALKEGTLPAKSLLPVAKNLDYNQWKQLNKNSAKLVDNDIANLQLQLLNDCKIISVACNLLQQTQKVSKSLLFLWNQLRIRVTPPTPRNKRECMLNWHYNNKIWELPST